MLEPFSIESTNHNYQAMERVVTAVQELSLARELTGVDGATFVLRDRDKCFYADEDACLSSVVCAVYAIQ